MAKRKRETLSIREIRGQKPRRKIVRRAPEKRCQCEDVPRPCPFVGCVYSMFLNVTAAGSIQFICGTRDPTTMPANMSCALDIIEERKSLSMREISEIWNVTKQRVAQIEILAIEKIRKYDLEWERL